MEREAGVVVVADLGSLAVWFLPGHRAAGPRQCQGIQLQPRPLGLALWR